MSSIKKWNPVAELSALQNQFFGDDWMTSLKGVNIPTTDVYTQDNQLRVEAHLPNFELHDVKITVEEDALIISAERHEKKEDEGKHYVVRESSSSFYRRIALPQGSEVDKIKARLEDGILKVVVPLAPLPAPKEISIAAKQKKK